MELLLLKGFALALLIALLDLYVRPIDYVNLLGVYQLFSHLVVLEEQKGAALGGVVLYVPVNEDILDFSEVREILLYSSFDCVPVKTAQEDLLLELV